jgi:hypothetical protein
MVFYTSVGSDKRKTSLWKHWDCQQESRIKVFNCKTEKIRDKGMPYHGFFILLYSDWGNPFQDIREKKKRYAHLVLENVGNFQIGYKDSIVVLTL